MKATPETRGRPRTIDRDLLRKLYHEGAPNVVLAEYFEVTTSAISQIVRRLDLPRRRKADADTVARARRRLGLGDPATRMAGPKHIRDLEGDKLLPIFAGHWTPEHDQELRATKGRYAALRELAELWRIPPDRVVARWHIARRG